MDLFHRAFNLSQSEEEQLRPVSNRTGLPASAAGGSKGRSEHILTCLSASPSNARVIRMAAQMAEALHGEFTALFVEPMGMENAVSSASGRQNSSDRYRGKGERRQEESRRLSENLRLAEQLGARISTVYGQEVALQVAEYAIASGVTKIVLGQTNHYSSPLGRRRSVAAQVMELLPDMDIYIIPDRQPLYRPRPRLIRREPLSWMNLAKMVLCVCLASAAGQLFYAAGLTEANIIMMYILGVLLASVWSGSWICGVLASVASVFLFNFLFTEPRFTLRAYDASYPVTFAVMLTVSFIANSMTMRIKNQVRQAAGKAYRTEILLETSQKLQKADTCPEILETAAGQLCKLLDRPILIFEPDGNGGLKKPWICAAGEDSVGQENVWDSEADRAAAQWSMEHNKHAGAATGIHSDAVCLYMAFRGKGRPMALAGIVMKGRPQLSAFEKNLMLAVIDQCGLALEKEHINREKQEVQMQMEKEALRANLLRSISHDLRTPLTSIAGNAGVLMENASVLSEQKKQELYGGIYDDSLWLMNLVENLLSVTRIEDGTMKLTLVPELVDEVVHEALAHVDRRSAEHEISWETEDDLLMVRMDARLMVQVIINLVNNAIRYTPAHSHIRVTARRIPAETAGSAVAAQAEKLFEPALADRAEKPSGQPGQVLIEVADDGPGVKPELREKLFEMFYTADNARGDGRRGLGLGLALCRSIIRAHGGEIGVRDAEPHGAVFYFTLQEAEVNVYGSI